MKFMSVFIVAVSLWVGACASAPAKQNTVITVQSVNQALGTLQDFEINAESSNLIPALDARASAAAVKLCPAGMPIAAPAANHNVIQCLFAVMFTAIKQATVDLKTWMPGSQTPFSLTQLKQYADDLLTFIKSVVPTSQQMIVTDAQAIVDALLQVASKMGVTL